jgi:copper chaperone NosL
MKFAPFLIIPFLILGCSSGPEPLVYGEDACHHCKMVLADQKFGAEIVTTKGKLYKFDDLNCMINFLNDGDVGEREVQHRLVIDFTVPGKLIDAGNAFYIKSSMVKSPMASQVAAFEHYDSMEKYKQELQGIYLTWGEVVTQFK